MRELFLIRGQEEVSLGNVVNLYGDGYREGHNLLKIGHNWQTAHTFQELLLKAQIWHEIGLKMLVAPVSKTLIEDHIKYLSMLSIFDFDDLKEKLERKVMDGVAAN